MLKEFNDEQMYHQAREQAEPEFAALLKKHGFEEVKQGSRLDDFQHNLLVNGMNEFRNELLAEDKPTEDVDRLLLLIIDAPTMRERRRANRDAR